ncbi:amidohydrolase [Bisporella sp. PMI_857]|nr:amidohydrolase [Bisporella sp. PMI_857]
MTKRVHELQPRQFTAAPVTSTAAIDAPVVSPEPLPDRLFSTAFGVTIRTKSRDIAHDEVDSIAATKRAFYTIIKADLLIPGDGEPVKDAALVIQGKLIAWVGSQSTLPQEYTENKHRTFSLPYLMPGLWDCHVHFLAGGDDDGYVGFIAEQPAATGARIARGCWEGIQRGYTSYRDVAGYGCEVAKAIDEGTIVGPNIYSSGACLSQLAGHGDIFPLPAGDVLLNLGVANITAGHQYGSGCCMIVDGVDECRRGVRLNIRRGAKCIKILASGGVLSRDDNPLYAQFSKEELETIVEEAHRQNRVVAAHVHGKPGIIAAVNAGVTTVEHVSFADQECIDLIKKKGVVYVATRLIVDFLLQSGGKGIPKESWEKAKLCGSNHLNAYKLAIKAGITFALGTDTPPGSNMALELEHAVTAGMSTLEAIKAATANGPLTVGGQAPLTGQLKAGYEADILGLTQNPVADVKILQKKDNIEYVWKGGRLFKGPGVGPWGEDDRWKAGV